MILKQTDVIKNTQGEVVVRLPIGSTPRTFVRSPGGVRLWYEAQTMVIKETDYTFYFVYENETIPVELEFMGAVSANRKKLAHVYSRRLENGE